MIAETLLLTLLLPIFQISEGCDTRGVGNRNERRVKAAKMAVRAVLLPSRQTG